MSARFNNILLVDDNESIRSVVTDMLSKMGPGVSSVENGENGPRAVAFLKIPTICDFNNTTQKGDSKFSFASFVPKPHFLESLFDTKPDCAIGCTHPIGICNNLGKFYFCTSLN